MLFGSFTWRINRNRGCSLAVSHPYKKKPPHPEKEVSHDAHLCQVSRCKAQAIRHRGTSANGWEHDAPDALFKLWYHVSCWYSASHYAARPVRSSHGKAVTHMDHVSKAPHMTELEVMIYHFQRIWKERHIPNVRYSVRQNIAAQRREKTRLRSLVIASE